MLAQLIVTTGPDRGRTFSLSPGQTLQIGRSAATATKLTDPTVSRVHCEVEWVEGAYVLSNVGSAGTSVNGKPVSQHELKLGDVIRLGGTEIRFQLDQGSEQSTLAPLVKAAPHEGMEKLKGLLGQTLAQHYVLEAILAKSDSGILFRATDTNSNKAVAFKVLKPDFAQNDEEMQRFIRAMKTVLPLRHPNLIALHGAG